MYKYIYLLLIVLKIKIVTFLRRVLQYPHQGTVYIGIYELSPLHQY